MENITQDYVKVIMVYQIDSSFITQYHHTEGVSNFCDSQKPIRHVDFKSRRRNNKHETTTASSLSKESESSETLLTSNANKLDFFSLPCCLLFTYISVI